MAVRFLVVCMLLAAFSSIALAERIECCQGDDCCDHDAILPCFGMSCFYASLSGIAADTDGTARIAVADVFHPPST